MTYCFICEKNIPVGERYYNISLSEEKETKEGEIEVLYAESLLVVCTKCGDKEKLKKICQEAGYPSPY